MTDYLIKPFVDSSIALLAPSGSLTANSCQEEYPPMSPAEPVVALALDVEGAETFETLLTY